METSMNKDEGAASPTPSQGATHPEAQAESKGGV
jgi:hypothetical protein